jgi:hypothetical protein
MIDLRNCIFGFKCTANWDDMKRTSEQRVRHCEQCEKNVYFITKPEELIEAINLNRCVALAPLESQNDLYYPRVMLGVPKSEKTKPAKPRSNNETIEEYLFGKIEKLK